MYKVIITLFLITVTKSVISQTLLTSSLSNVEKKRGVVSKYQYEEKGSYGVIKLLLFKNGKFEYRMKSFNRDVFSEGQWKRTKDLIILKNKFQPYNIPISINYSNDTSMRVNGCRFNVVRNLKSEEITDAMIKINNDTTQCLPSYGSCYGSYTLIDSIKIYFENGMSTKWINVSNYESKQIVLTVKTDFLPSSYFPFDRLKYKVRKNLLKPIN